MLLAISISISFLLISIKNWKRFKFFPVSPSGAYSIIWGVIWLIHCLDLFDYYEVSDEAILYSILSLVGIFCGECLGLLWKVKVNSQVKEWSASSVNKLLVINNLFIIFLAVIVFISVYSIFGPPWEPGVGKIIKSSRELYGKSMLQGGVLFGVIQYVDLARGFIYLSLIISIPLLSIQKKKGMTCFLSAFIAAVLNDLSWGSRVLLLDIGIFVVISFILVWRNNSNKSSVYSKYPMLFFVVSLLIGAAFIAQVITTSTRLKEYEEIGGVKVPYGAVQVAKYYSSPLVTFDKTLDDNPITYGLMSFGGVLNWAYRLRIYRGDSFVYDIWLKWEKENPFYGDDPYARSNIYTALRYFYSDFGVIGLVLIPFALGFTGSVFAKKAQNSSDKIGWAFSVCGLSYCYYIVFRSPMIFPFRVDYFVFSVFLMMFLYYYARKSKPSLGRYSRHRVKSA